MILSYAMEQPDAKDLRDSAENSSGELIVSAARFVSVCCCFFVRGYMELFCHFCDRVLLEFVWMC